MKIVAFLCSKSIFSNLDFSGIIYCFLKVFGVKLVQNPPEKVHIELYTYSRSFLLGDFRNWVKVALRPEDCLVTARGSWVAIREGLQFSFNHLPLFKD